MTPPTVSSLTRLLACSPKPSLKSPHSPPACASWSDPLPRPPVPHYRWMPLAACLRFLAAACV